MGDMKVRTVEQPEGTGENFSAGDIAIGISYARFLTDRFSVGLTAKYIKQSIWHMSSSAFAIDAGTVFRTDLLGGMTTVLYWQTSEHRCALEGRMQIFYSVEYETKQGSNEKYCLLTLN
jgi:hypothetical protein